MGSSTSLRPAVGCGESGGGAMKTVVVTGSRKWSDPAPLQAALRGADVLIVGDCPPDRTSRSSADALALSIALRWDVVTQVFAASSARAEFLRSKGIHVELVSDWERDGDRAGPLRNFAIARAASAARKLGEVKCHAFPLEDSVGTFDCMRKLKTAGFVVEIHPAQKILAREQNSSTEVGSLRFKLPQLQGTKTST